MNITAWTNPPRLLRRIGFCWLPLLAHLSLAASEPVIARKLDTRPDRGNRKSSPYVTGPTPGIAKLQNDDLEISFWNRPWQMTFSLAKNDVWDRRYFADGKKLITLDDVRRACFSVHVGDKKDLVYPGYGGLVGRNSDLGLPNAPHALYRAYDFPCPKPVGQIIVRCPDVEGHDSYVAGTATDGSLVASATRGETRATLRALLHRTRNLLVLRGEYEGLARPLRIQLYRHKDTTP